MRLFRRRDPLADLGEGIWRRAHDRFHRAVDRYHQMLEAVPAGAARASLEADGARLAAALEKVRNVCRDAQTRSPSASLEVPTGAHAGMAELHRSLSRAAGIVAQAAEAAAMARVAVRAGDEATAAGRTAAATRAVDGVLEHLRGMAG